MRFRAELLFLSGWKPEAGEGRIGWPYRHIIEFEGVA
jgi:hypothetical protein